MGTYDAVAQVRTDANPPFAARKARVLILDPDSPSAPSRVAVFTTLTAPSLLADIESRPTAQTLKLADGTTLTYRPVGSSCQWLLAKCKVPTQTLLGKVAAATTISVTPDALTTTEVATDEPVDPHDVPEDVELTAVDSDESNHPFQSGVADPGES